jgi:peptidyl-prolyl cis-trans isomerase D
MMRAMREITKPVFWVVAITFIGWMAYGQVSDILGGGRDVVLKVDGVVVRQQPFQQQYQAMLEQYRRQQGGARLTREDERQIQDRVVDQFVQNILLERAYRRLGITISDEEIIEAARSSPPPQILQQVLQDPTFQTNGQFDITKWQRYLSSASPEFRAQIEQLFREFLPQRKLEDYLTADVYVSDAKLWRLWRDQHEAVTVALLSVRPEDVPDSLVSISDVELARYYDAHRSDFKRPAAAWLSYVALPRVPDHADSAVAFARVRALRAEIVAGKIKFADAAKKESADSGTAARGGDLGWTKRSGSTFVAPFARAIGQLPVGVVSEPVLTQFGYHLIRIDSAKGDSVQLRHILVPIALQGHHLDEVDARTDTLDRLAAEQTDGTRLESAARQLELVVQRAPKLVKGERLFLGQSGGGGGPVPDVGVWAFEGRTGETSPVIDGGNASYVFRLDSLEAGGVPPLSQVRTQVLAAARYDKKRGLIRERAAQAAAALRDASDLLTAGRARGYHVTKLGPFTRITAPSDFAREPVLLGAAFGLRPGERSGVVVGGTGCFVIQSLAHQPADSAAWLKQRGQQREALMRPVVQARVQQYLAALRAQAKVVDRREELFRPGAASAS